MWTTASGRARSSIRLYVLSRPSERRSLTTTRRSLDFTLLTVRTTPPENARIETMPIVEYVLPPECNERHKSKASGEGTDIGRPACSSAAAAMISNGRSVPPIEGAVIASKVPSGRAGMGRHIGHRRDRSRKCPRACSPGSQAPLARRAHGAGWKARLTYPNAGRSSICAAHLARGANMARKSTS